MYMCMCVSVCVCARKREYGYVCEPEGSSYSGSCSYNFRGQTEGKHGRPQSLDGEMVFSMARSNCYRVKFQTPCR